jgi:DNA invertase Pin-like site-specific DNA recombinase
MHLILSSQEQVPRQPTPECPVKLSLSKFILDRVPFVYNPQWKFRQPARWCRWLAPLSRGRRVSGKSQIAGDGFPRQLAAIRKYAEAHGAKIVRVFREEGVSGTKELENRPALLDLMTALHSNGTKLVMVEELDRLARDLMIQETIIGDLRKSGFELISVAEPDLLQDDPSRKLMRQIFGAIAEYEKTMIVLKLRGARMRVRAKTGRCHNR